jgi:hypothetical protein
VETIGQIEVDELYVGVNTDGAQFIIPVQAKGRRDQIGVVQALQDLACCAQKFPNLVARAVAAQFRADNVIAMLELAEKKDDVFVVNERHYVLLPNDQISSEDLALYRRRITRAP